MYFAFDAMCSDALRCAGMRSSGGLWAIFHGDNTGSNPVGDAKLNHQLRVIFAVHSGVQNGRVLVSSPPKPLIPRRLDWHFH